MARNHVTFEKRRKELEKRKKKEAKRQKKLERKAEKDAGAGPPIGELDEFGNTIELEEDMPEEPEEQQDPE